MSFDGSWRPPGVHDLVFADGGSCPPPGAAGALLAGSRRQLRAGTREATGNVLLFLHADVVPSCDVAAQISEAVPAGCVGGNFRLRYTEVAYLGRWREILAPFYRRAPATMGTRGSWRAAKPTRPAETSRTSR